MSKSKMTKEKIMELVNDFYRFLTQWLTLKRIPWSEKPKNRIEDAITAVYSELEDVKKERDATIAPKKFAHLSFEHDFAKNSFCDKLCDLIEDFTDIGWDYYDRSLEIYEVPNDERLTEEAQRFIFDAGFGRVWINHLGGFETYYSFGKEFKVSEGHHAKANWHRTHESAPRRVIKENDRLEAENRELKKQLEELSK